MKKDFYTAVENRRSVYAISKEKVISDQAIKEVIEHAVKNTPSAFNSQSARVVLLLKKKGYLLKKVNTLYIYFYILLLGFV